MNFSMISLLTMFFTFSVNAASSRYYDDYRSIKAATKKNHKESSQLENILKNHSFETYSENFAFVIGETSFVIDGDFSKLNNDMFVSTDNLKFLLNMRDVTNISMTADGGDFQMVKFIGCNVLGVNFGELNYINNASIEIENEIENDKITISMEMFEHSTIFNDTATKITFSRLKNKIKVEATLIASLRRNALKKAGLKFQNLRKSVIQNATDSEIKSIENNLLELAKINL